ncbi:MAG: TonB-dependent receptor family protein [Candidatus Tectimicrobiota bacterium]
MKTFAVCCLLVCCLLMLALAQAQERPTRLPPVVVTETPLQGGVAAERRRSEAEARQELERLPGGSALVGAQEIRDSRGANFQDVLEFVPGVLIRPRFGAADESQLSVRGSGLRNNFHLRGVNILLDGFLYGNADGFSDFEALELLSTKYIEVYKAANALRFGANALGGAINLVTKTGYDAGLLELRSQVGSFGFFKNHLATGQVYGPFDVYIGFTDTELEGYRAHSEQVRRRLYSTYGYRLPGGTTLRLDLSYVRNEENLPGSLTRQEFEQNPRQRNPNAAFAQEARNYDYTRVAFTVRTPLTTTQVLEAATHFNFQDLDHPLSFAVIDDRSYNWGTELRYLLSAPLLGHQNRLIAGVQYAGLHQVDQNFANVQSRRGMKTKNQDNIATNVGLYLEDQFNVTEALLLVAGGRFQYADRRVEDHFLSNGEQSGYVDYFAFSPKLGLVWRLAPTVQVYGNISHSYEPPIVVELTSPGRLQGGLEDLQAQKAWQFELGTRGMLGSRLLWDVAVYDIELWDEIQNINVQPFPGAPFTLPRYQNINRSRHLGVEVGATLVLLRDLLQQLNLGQAGDKLALRLAYTWSRFLFVDDARFGNNTLPGAPEHFLRGEVRYDHAGGFWIAPGLDSTPAGYPVDSANTVQTDPYTLVNLRLGYDYKPWQLGVAFEARNLTDKRYTSAVAVDDGNGRFFQPGDGRAFYGTVNWRWQ